MPSGNIDCHKDYSIRKVCLGRSDVVVFWIATMVLKNYNSEVPSLPTQLADIYPRPILDTLNKVQT